MNPHLHMGLPLKKKKILQSDDNIVSPGTCDFLVA